MAALKNNVTWSRTKRRHRTCSIFRGTHWLLNVLIHHQNWVRFGKNARSHGDSLCDAINLSFEIDRMARRLLVRARRS
jgi:hypothetical protein